MSDAGNKMRDSGAELPGGAIGTCDGSNWSCIGFDEVFAEHDAMRASGCESSIAWSCDGFG